MPTPLLRRSRLLEDLSPLPRLVRLTAPAGYGKTTLARAVLEAVGHGGVCDLAYVATPRDLLRAIVEALARGEDDARRSDIADQFFALGDDAITLARYGRSVVRAVARPTVLCLENGEAIADRSDLCALLADVLRDASDALHAVVCSRVQRGVELGRFAGPDVTRVLSAAALRFDRDEIRTLCADLSLSESVLDRIETFSNGWPIVVTMLHQLAGRGRLHEFLFENRDEADLYGYLATQVNNDLSVDERELLTVLAAIPNATERDVVGSFPACAELLRGLSERTPFISRTSRGTIEVHPAMREMLLARVDRTTILERIFATLSRDDGGVRAAQIAMHLDRPRDAARALAGLNGGYLLTAVTPELNAVLSDLPSDVLVDVPEIWSVAMIARAFAIDPLVWIDEGERAYAACTQATAAPVRGGIAMSLINAYANRGRWNDAAAFSRRFVDECDDAQRPLAQSIVDFWAFAMDTYRGRAVDLSLLETRHATLMLNGATRALTVYDVVARVHRLEGDRERARAALEWAADLAAGTKIPLVEANVFMDAAFNAWFFGEDDRCDFYLERLAAAVTPNVERGVAFFLACATGRADDAACGFEKLKNRAYAYLIAAAREDDRAKRCNYAREAVIAADLSDQPFARVIARTALGLCEAGVAGRRAFDEAERIARETCSVALPEAVTRARDADASGTMLDAFVARFARASATSHVPRVVIDLATGVVAVDGRDVRFTEREAELVALLALRGPMHPDALADILWPEVDGDRALASLKTYVSRLRRVVDDPAFVVREPHRCRLGAPAIVRGGRAVAHRFARWHWMEQLGDVAMRA